MDTLSEGISSPQVLQAQKLINAYYQQSLVPESGDFDSATTAGVKRFQKDEKLSPNGSIDGKTMALLIKPPKVAGFKFTYNGKEIWINATDLPAAKKQFCAVFNKAIGAYRRKVEEGRNLWDAHNQVRKDTFWLIPAMVDLRSGAKFPSEDVIKAAEKAVAAMQGAADAGNIEGIGKIMEAGHKIIEMALKQIRDYRDNMYDGGDKLVSELGAIRDGCVLTLTVTAAIATAGSSTAVTAGVMGGLGAYKETLNQIDAASKDPKVTVTSAFGNVLVAGMVDATVGALLKSDGPFVKNVTEALGKKAAAAVGRKIGGELIAKIVEKAVDKALQSLIKGSIEKMVKAFKPGQKMTLKDAVEDIVGDVFKDLIVGGVLGGFDKALDGFSANNASKIFKKGDFKGLGDVDFQKALKEGASSYIEEATKRLSTAIMLQIADKETKADAAQKRLQKELAEAMMKDSKLNASLAALVKSKKLAA